MAEQKITLKAPRPAGQEIGNTPPSVVVEQKPGHKADPLAYTRSRKKVYLRKIEKQKINKANKK